MAMHGMLDAERVWPRESMVANSLVPVRMTMGA